MLRVGQLRKTSGAIADGAVVSESPPEPGAWGDGLVDRSLTSLWYPTDWDEVNDDELAFLLPALSAWRPESVQARNEGQSGSGPVGYLTHVLIERARGTAALMAARSHAEPKHEPSHLLELLVTHGMLTAVPLTELLPSDTDRSPVIPVALPPQTGRAGNTGLPDWLALELTALAHLDRMLRDASGRQQSGTPLVDWPLSLADLLIATVNARFNGAYVHPEFSHAHELLTAAALLGHLMHRREVYIPPQLAQCLADQLAKLTHAATREEDWSSSIIRLYADLAGGAARTRARAKRSAASGRPYLVKPRAPVIPADIGRTTWNARLLQRIGRSWEVLT